MTAPTTAMCPFCRRGVRWFYGTATFGRHKDRAGKSCEARRWEGRKGTGFNASDPRFNGLRLRKAFRNQAEPATCILHHQLQPCPFCIEAGGEPG